MSKLALKLIAENKAKYARGEDARMLNLGNCGLAEVPEEVGKLVWLEELILSNFYGDWLNKEIKYSINKGEKLGIVINHHVQNLHLPHHPRPAHR